MHISSATKNIASICMPIPLVSVLVPVYNVENYIRECLDSIVKQTYKFLQVVIINDGSTDSSGKICQEYADKYSFVEFYSQSNAGVAVTRNRLLEKVKGDYFLFIDSDDWIEKDMIDFLVGKALEHDIDIITCENIRNINNEILHYREQILNKEEFIQKFLFHKELNGSLWNKLIKSKVAEDVHFEPGISYGEDAFFFWQCLQKTNSMMMTNKQCYHYRRNQQRLSRQKWTPEGKGSGPVVWDSICNDVAQNYPQFIDIAHARFALEDMWALFFASICGYKYDKHIEIRQTNIREHTRELMNYPIDGKSKMWVALILSRCYWAGKLIRLVKS